MNDSPVLGTDYVYRQYSDKDFSFVVSSWLKGYASCSSNPFRKDNYDRIHALYWKYQADLIEQLLDIGRCVVICDKERPEVIFGYCVYEIREPVLILHWCYVKKDFRNMGVMTELIGHLRGMIEGCAKHTVITHLHNHYSYIHNGRVNLVDRKQNELVYLPEYCWKD